MGCGNLRSLLHLLPWAEIHLVMYLAELALRFGRCKCARRHLQSPRTFEIERAAQQHGGRHTGYASTAQIRSTAGCPRKCPSVCAPGGGGGAHAFSWEGRHWGTAATRAGAATMWDIGRPVALSLSLGLIWQEERQELSELFNFELSGKRSINQLIHELIDLLTFSLNA